MGRRKRRQFRESARRNTEAYLDWLDKITGIALGTWIYKLPKEIDTRWLEKTLLAHESVALFNEPVLGVPCAMKFVPAGNLDSYENPIDIHVYNEYSQYNRFLKKGEYVILHDNLERTRLFPFLERTAERLWDLDCTIDVNAKVQKTPAMIVTSEDKRLSTENAIMKIDGNMPYILVSESMNLDDYRVLNLGGSSNTYKGEELMKLETDIFNQCLARIGVQSAVALKRERMVQAEVQQLDNFALANRRSRILAREQAFEDAKNLLGWDCSFEFFEGYEIGYNKETYNKSEEMQDANGISDFC